MDRQETALIIVGVPLRQLLVAVHNIDRVVVVIRYSLERKRAGVDPTVD